MFTGLVEEIGEIIAVEPTDNSVRLTVKGPKGVADAGHGAFEPGIASALVRATERFKQTGRP